MTRGLAGQAALVLAAALLLFTGASTRAEPATDGAAAEQPATTGKPLALTKPKVSRTHKASRSSKLKVAALTSGKRKMIARKAGAKADPKPEAEIPAAVANANAQMPGVEARGQASMTGAAPLEAAATDQLTELGRSLTTTLADDEPRRITTQLVMNDQPQSALPMSRTDPEAAPAPQRTVGQASQMRSSDSAWAGSSLIGKIFIAFGGMLTLASAARMLIA